MPTDDKQRTAYDNVVIASITAPTGSYATIRSLLSAAALAQVGSRPILRVALRRPASEIRMATRAVPGSDYTALATSATYAFICSSALDSVYVSHASAPTTVGVVIYTA